MPGAHVDEMIKQARERLEYVGKTPQELSTMTKEEKDLDTQRRRNEVGGEVFNDIESSKLTPSEKQEVYQALGRSVVEEGINKVVDGKTLLRGNNAGTNFMSAYMNKYAGTYFEAVSQKAITAMKGVPFPDDPELTNTFPKPGDTSQDFTGVNFKPDTITSLNESYEKVGRIILESTESEISKMSPEAIQFLKAMSDQTREMGKEESINNLMAGTVMLRGVSTKIFNEGAKLTNSEDPGKKLQGKFLINSSTVMQSYSNAVDLEQIDLSKNVSKMAEKLRTPQALNRTKDMFDALSRGTDMSLPGKIAKMEAELDRLKNKPTFGDKFKAIFQGGMDKVKEKLIDKIDAAKTQILQTRDSETFAQVQKQNQDSVQGLRNNLSEKVDQAKAYIRAKGTVEEIDKDMGVMEGVGKSGIGPEFTPEKRQEMLERRERAVETMDLNKSGHDEFMQNKSEMEKLEKNMSVRDSLGMNQKAPQTEVPKQTVAPKL